MATFKRVRNGIESSTYYVKFMFGGKQVLRNTELTNKADADQFERNLRRGMAGDRADKVKQLATNRSDCTFATMGQLKAAYEAEATVVGMARESIVGNIGRMRQVLKTSYPNVEDVWSLSTTVLTPDLLRKFREDRITKSQATGQALESVKTTINSNFKRVKSWFSRRMRAAYASRKLQLPNTKEMCKVGLLSVVEKAYTYQKDLVDLTMTRAMEDSVDQLGREIPSLRKSDPSVYLAFLLGIACGFRKGESMRCKWSWFSVRADGRVLCKPQGDETWKGPKGKKERQVPVEQSVWAELNALKVADISGDGYVIPGSPKERTTLVWLRLSAWMVSLGWTTRTKSHELRRAYGAKVACTHGLYAAQKLLGHGNARTTSQYYAALVDIPDVCIFGTAAPAPAAVALAS